jgi:hypothetical protein
MFPLVLCDEIKITKNLDGTYKIEGKIPIALDNDMRQGTIIIPRSNVYLKIDALADDRKSIMTWDYVK